MEEQSREKAASVHFLDGINARVAALVHYLDVGGVQPSEAASIERVLAGRRETILNDDRLITAACGIFDGLLAAFVKDETADE